MYKIKFNRYKIIKKAISKELANFCYNYFLLKRQVAETMFKTTYISPYEEAFGVWEQEHHQVPGTYSHYSDPAMETLLMRLKEKTEKITNKSLIENYSYARIYKKGDVLKRHKDRFSCEISTTLNLGGDKWPIYINPDENAGNVYEEKKGVHQIQKYQPSNDKGVKVILNPGDMLVYRGDLLEHWREPFEGEHCVQVFLHYNDVKTEGADKNAYDTRPHLGLPSWYKRIHGNFT